MTAETLRVREKSESLALREALRSPSLSYCRKQSPNPASKLVHKMFHDLSLGVDGIDDNSRRELVSTALQLGYTSIAANHVHAGMMADSDRSKVKPLDVASVLAAAPGTAESVRFHQKLLGVPAGRPFRQYRRITVVVDDTVQAAALNSANPVLRTYDIVAVRPTNQRAFQQACTHLEVDLISVDLFQRLPFRMKAPLVKAAIQRGVFFEISYGRALFDARARREIFANGQVLQAVTQGRGIIVSSGARQAMELRGPNDVANMATLFGLSIEVAKAAVSKNCESVILHGVARKKSCDAILIERVPPAGTAGEAAHFEVPGVWDPLSVGTAKGAAVDLSPLLDAAIAKESERTQKGGISTEAGLVVPSSVPGRPDETFISMVTASSEWTEVGKRGKHPKGRRPKEGEREAADKKDSKKPKFF